MEKNIYINYSNLLNEHFEEKKKELLNKTKNENENSTIETDYESIGSDEFEDVNISVLDSIDQNQIEDQVISVNIDFDNDVEKTKLRKKKSVMLKEEKNKKIFLHQTYLISQIIHGQKRNYICNNIEIGSNLCKIISKKILLSLKKIDDNKNNIVKSNLLINVLKTISETFFNNFTITLQGIIKKDWDELHLLQKNGEGHVNFIDIKKSLFNLKGSVDLGAQGLTCLLRFLGFNARLIFSIQIPDFKSSKEIIKKQCISEVLNENLKKKFCLKNIKDNILNNIRSNSVSDFKSDDNFFQFNDSSYPVFWTEVWNKYTLKWISIDAFVTKVAKIVLIKNKCVFEPPPSHLRNQLVYVIAYDNCGKLKDVTRRYSHNYNVKTFKKRIERISNDHKSWYNVVLNAVSNNKKLELNNIERIEIKEFQDRDNAESFPNNVSDFKNHPFYVLDKHLKYNEFINPNDPNSVCGMFRQKTKSTVEKEKIYTVYNRKLVQHLRTSSGWFLKGKKVKENEIPLKKKKINSHIRSLEANEKDEVGLYSESQTKLYIPEPIINNVIPKNEYGNIFLFAKSMIPKNGFYIEIDKFYTSSKLDSFFKKYKGLDHAKAIVGYKFDKKMKNFNPVVGGYVIDEQNKTFFQLAFKFQIDEEKKAKKKKFMTISLNNWRHFLLSLRICSDLNRKHGKIEY